MVDSHDPTGATVYVTIMGFGQTGSIPHVYRSADFGAHWTDISANLPNAPANALVVDPNDANTLYVALDTGVYTTRQVSTCATQNCWSPFGTALPNAPVTGLQAAPNLPTGDGRLGMLRAATYGRGLWQTPLLSAVSDQKPNLSVQPTSLTFAAQAAATESAAQTVTLTSTGASPVTITSVAITGEFIENDTCTGQTIPVGATCTLAVQFAPTAAGARPGLLTIYANITGGQVTVALSGTATAPAAVVLTPVSLMFPSTTVNGTAHSEIITVSNTGDTSVTLQTPAITGDFTIQQNTCGTSLPPQTGCSVAITFTPTASGARTGVFTVTDSVGTQTAQLSGTGQSPATDTASPVSLSFAPQQTATASTPQQVTVTNAGDVPLALFKAVITHGDFLATNTCGSSLAPHSTCAISVSFAPTSVGTLTGTLTISDQIRYQNIPLTGMGTAPAGISVTPATLSFEATGVGLHATPQTLTVTNNGGTVLTLTPPTLGGDFALASSTCGATLAAGYACTMVIYYAPSAPGPQTGVLTLTDTAPGGKQTVNLKGLGVDFTLVPNGSTSVTTASGGSATFPLLLSSLPALSGSVALTCTGAPATTKCTVSPASAALGANVQVSVVVQTGLATAAVSPLEIRKRHEGLLLAGLPVLFLCCWPRRRAGLPLARGAYGFLLGLCLLGSIALGSLLGCASSRIIPTSGSGGGGADTLSTPSGTYNLIVGGTTAGVTHQVGLTLTVQN